MRKVLLASILLIILIGGAGYFILGTAKLNKGETSETSAEVEEILDYSDEELEKLNNIEQQIITHYNNEKYDTVILHYRNTFLSNMNNLQPTKKIIELYNKSVKRIFDNASEFPSRDYDELHFKNLNKDTLAFIESKFGTEIAEHIEEMEQLENERESQKVERRESNERKRLIQEKASRGVTIGMTKDDVLLSSWGAPSNINKTVNAYGTSEQWVYDNYNYLYFDNGILTSIQTSN
ncbi:hypothetical protein ACQKII_23690 [Lysinibacillus sp. NPDC048646]|uniref:hypothetical protein n=1 Tax=Lysinibacillus sp. NPDC048646 TaxID=3390574 RepID=UPI003CFEBD57